MTMDSDVKVPVQKDELATYQDEVSSTLGREQQAHQDKHQITRNRNFFRSMFNALKGIFLVLVRERNMRFHVGFAIFVLAAGLYLGLNRSEWLWVVIAVFLAVYGEFMNTVVEAVIDLMVDKRYHPLAGLVKDVSAGMVLVSVFAEMIILFLIFQPHLWHFFGIETDFSRFIYQLKG
ncbi:diacylglycerol kinase family protein [Fructobacillus sp. W13]|uniref:Diacylglycerol kinase family protein n=1 Tax=Fructobacillus apis TaxID=2935017 RepID=A0ABT0ZNE3_9LACO|nr:diacylglycerol kinase family protein [Fructobacillus apis]MCO0831513.1 diacylglycerol kinase family protein [Fructobacillus apis]